MIDIKQVHKSFGNREILKGIDLHVPTGSVTVILGPSGSGKTTFLRTLNFLEKADAGTMQLNDISVDLHKASNKEILNARRNTSMVFQSYNLAKKAPNAPIPLHLRNSTSKITKELDYNKGYQWTAGFKHPEDNLPKEVRELISSNKQNEKILTGEWSPEIKELTK